VKVFMFFHILLYRLSKGAIGGTIGGNPILLLSTIGRRSGKRYTTPLMYMHDGADYILIASAMGAAKHPSWYFNLQSHPQTMIQVGTTTIAVEAHEATGTERQRLWDRLLVIAPFLAKHEQKAQRTIPVIVLRPK
jgi:F420H(2)-dependent quinone reductase